MWMASRRSAEGLVAVREDSPVAGREAIAHRRAARRVTRHGQAVAQIDRRGVQLPDRAATVGGAGQRPSCVAEPPIPLGVLKEGAPTGPVGGAVGREERCRRLAAWAQGSGARGERLVVARGGEVAAGEQQAILARCEHHLRVVRRRLPRQERLVDGQQDGRGSDDAGSVGAQLRRPDLRRRRRSSTVIGLPEQVGGTRRRIDERARVQHAHGRRIAIERPSGGVREHRGTEGRRGRHRDAAVPRIVGIGVHRGVVEHDPVPSVVEDAGRGLGIGCLPGWRAGERARPRPTGIRVPARCGRARRVGQGLNEVASGSSRRERVVRPTGVQDVRVRCVSRVRRRRTGCEGNVRRQLFRGRSGRLRGSTGAECATADERHQTKTADQQHWRSSPWMTCDTCQRAT